MQTEGTSQELGSPSYPWSSLSTLSPGLWTFGFNVLPGAAAFLGEEEAVACEFLVGLVALLRLQASVVSPFSEVLLELALTAAPQAGACGD